MPILWRDDHQQADRLDWRDGLAALLLIAGAVLVLGGFVIW